MGTKHQDPQLVGGWLVASLPWASRNSSEEEVWGASQPLGLLEEGPWLEEQTRPGWAGRTSRMAPVAGQSGLHGQGDALLRVLASVR